MKIPNKLKIGGIIYKIVMKHDRLKSDGESHCGTTVSFHSTIWIDTSASKGVQEQTLIHEIVEAINIKNDLNLNHSQISTIAEDLYQVFKDNNLLK